ncbi:response regulator [Polyangium spumosum]|nr:response regulator [Polyangium spumosum]
MPRILIIDDDAAFGASAVRTLEGAGFSARFHRGPFGSLQAIRESLCDVVLLDVNMPKLDGPLLVRMIRDAFGLGSVKVLLCSDMEPGPLERLAKVMGVHGAVPKQVHGAELVDQVRAALPRSATA